MLGIYEVDKTSGGSIVGEDRFYPFGETRLATGNMFTDKLFTGQREITGLGIYHYRARFYFPKLGRFIQPDTIVPGEENPQALNRYSYVFNNPINDRDPSGHCPTASCGGSSGGMLNIHVSPPIYKPQNGPVNIGLNGIFIFTPLDTTTLVDGFDQLSGELKILFARDKKKGEKRRTDWLQKKNRLGKKDRRNIHDDITREGLTDEELESEWQEYKRLKDKKQKEKEQDKE